MEGKVSRRDLLKAGGAGLAGMALSTLGIGTILGSETAAAGALRADAAAFPSGAIVRARREGDVFTPYKGKRKSLKEYLTDKKISARAGRELPLVAKDDSVYAIFGVEISDAVKVTEQTERIVYLACEK